MGRIVNQSAGTLVFALSLDGAIAYRGIRPRPPTNYLDGDFLRTELTDEYIRIGWAVYIGGDWWSLPVAPPLTSERKV